MEAVRNVSKKTATNSFFDLCHFCVMNETRAVRAMNEALKQNRREQGENSSSPHTSSDRGGALDLQKNVCYLLSGFEVPNTLMSFTLETVRFCYRFK